MKTWYRFLRKSFIFLAILFLGALRILADIVTLNGEQAGDYEFIGTNTYYLTNVVAIDGTATFDAGTVIKYGPDSALIVNNVDCETTSNNPAIFTARDDDTVGDILPDSTHVPPIGGYTDFPSWWPGEGEFYPNTALLLNKQDDFTALSHIKISYAQYGIFYSGSGGFTLDDGDIYDCNMAIYAGNWNFIVSNSRISHGGVDGDVYSAVWTNVVFNDVSIWDDGYGGGTEGDGGTSQGFINSLLANTGIDGTTVTYGGSSNQFYNSTAFGDNYQILDLHAPSAFAQTIFTGPDISANVYLAAYSPDGKPLTYFLISSPAHGLLSGMFPYLLYTPNTDYTGADSFTFTVSDGVLDSTNATVSINVSADDSDSDGLPDWWEMKYFGNLDHSGSDLDSSGNNTLLSDYEYGVDPNTILFSSQLPPEVYSNDISGTLAILGGTPFYEAVLINDTNNADAIWQPYNGTNLSISFPSNSLYTVWVGLRGLPNDAVQTWQETPISVFVASPVFVITNPIIADGAVTVSTPLIQVQGLVNESLSELTYDVSNLLGVVTNQQGYWNPICYNTNIMDFTTNAFQCYDVPLTNGLNTITLHATDSAGNTVTTNFNVTLDYSGDTTPPTLNVLWPQNGTVIAGSNFTMQAQVDDNTATVITVINGQTNTALVERDGTVWVNNLPLNSGTNELALMATDAAGNSSTTNLTLIQSSVTVNVDPISEDQANQSSVTVTGTSSDPSINITVNGTNAYYIDDFGDWEADEVPVSPTGAAALDVQAGDGSDNPLGEEQVSQIQAAVVVTASAKENYTFNGMDNYNPPHAPWPAGKFGLLEWTADQGGGESDDSYGPNDAGTAEYSPGPMGEDLSGDGSDYDDAFGYKWQNADLNTFIAEDNLSGSWQYKAQTTVMIVPPKQQAIGQTALYLVKMVLWGYSNPYDDSGDNGDVPLSPDEFTVNGQPLVNTGMTNEDGSIVGEAVVTGHSGALLPVSISGNEPIYSFSNPKPQAQKIDLEMGVDANRDGNITFDSADQTTGGSPYHFWINDDDDSGNDEIVPATSRNCDDIYINGPRDLEDMSRLHLLVQGITNELANGTFLVGLKWKNVTGAPAINIFPAIETNGGMLYLIDTNVAIEQASPLNIPCVIILNNQNDYHQVDTTGTFLINSNFWNGFAGNKKYLLFEGCSVGKGLLVITINKPDGTEIAEAGGVWMDLEEVTNMFERAHISNVSTTFPEMVNTTNTSTFVSDYTLGANPDETKQLIIFVHGWRMTGVDYTSFSSTMFKRLWWEEYKGRFAALRWPTLSSDTDGSGQYFTYNRSEHIAFDSGAGMSAYLDWLRGRFSDYSINVAAHSMGNIVMMEALKDQLAEGHSVVDNYVMMQAAITAHCYDTSLANYSLFINKEATSPTPDIYRGYPGNISAAVNNKIVNFFNVNDYALAKGIWHGFNVSWEGNEVRFKPDVHWDYSSDGMTCSNDYSGLRTVTNPHEQMAFVSRPRAKAAGALEGVGGEINGGELDLGNTFGFGDAFQDHSAEFNWTFQQLGGTTGFYHALLNGLFPPQ